jgi:hypothetical protein
LEQGLVQPGAPVYADIIEPDGSITRTWNSSTAAVSSISNQELDRELAEILQNFPYFVRRMINSFLLSKGIKVVLSRIRASYVRVHGSPPVFGNRAITRKVYFVPGVNSLWHHDGQHGEYSLTIPSAQTSYFCCRPYSVEAGHLRFH